MKKNFRGPLLWIGLGIMFFVIGIRENKLSQKAQMEPSVVSLADVEKGTELSNIHVTLQDHWALYPYMIYVYEKGWLEGDEPGPDAKVKYVYYPIVSVEHPFIREVFKVLATYGDNVPEDKEPEFKDFSILVKSKRFKTVGDLPDNWGTETNLTGLFINEIEKIDDDEMKLIKETWPDLDMDKVLVLEEGRTPTGQIMLYVYWVLGVLMVVLGIFRFKKKLGQPDPQESSQQ